MFRELPNCLVIATNCGRHRIIRERNGHFVVVSPTLLKGMETELTEASSKAELGVHGLDDITAGGLSRGRLFLLEGSPGTGKTTIATQFLMAGAAAGESALYITLSETEDELRASAASHGWSLDGIDIFELVPPESLLDEDQQQSLL